MKEYLVSVITVSVGLSVARLLVSFGDGKGVYKAVSFVTALIFFVAVISPVRGIPSLAEYFENLPDLPETEEKYDGVWQSRIKDVSEEKIGAYVKEILSEEFGTDDCVISCDFDADMRPERINITVNSGGLFTNPRRAEKRVSEIFGCECVLYGR